MLSILLSDHSNWTFFEFLVTLQIFLGRRSWIKIFGMFGIRGHQSSVQLVVHEAYVYQSRGRMMMAPSWGVRSFSDDDLGLALAHTGYQQRCCPPVSHRPCIYGKHGRWWWQKFLQNFFGGWTFTNVIVMNLILAYLTGILKLVPY